MIETVSGSGMGGPRRWKKICRWVFAASFILAGINHFWHVSLYVRIMPPYLPWPTGLVWLSGVCEMGLGALLLWLPATRLAAWGLIALLAAVFPANLHMALHPEQFSEIAPWLLRLRLPFQGFFMAWAYWHTSPEA